jgi:hypothetical protein
MSDQKNRFRITSIIVIAIITFIMMSSSIVPLLTPSNVNMNQPAHILTISDPIQIVDSTPYESTFGANNIVEMPNGNWLAVYYVGTWHVSADGRINGSISLDYGVTWDASFNIVDNASVDDRNPAVTVIGSRIIVYYSAYDGNGSQTEGQTDSYGTYSDDNATTWSASYPLWLEYQLQFPYDDPIFVDGKYYLPYYGQQNTGNSSSTALRSFVSLTSSTDGLTFAERTQIDSCDTLTNWTLDLGTGTILSLSDDCKEGGKSIELNGSSQSGWLELLAHEPGWDLSSYDGLSLWFWMNISSPTTLSTRLAVVDTSGNYVICWGYSRYDDWTQFEFNFSHPGRRSDNAVNLAQIHYIEVGLYRATAFTGAFRIDDIAGTNWDTIIVDTGWAGSKTPSELTVVEAANHYIGVWRDGTVAYGWIAYSDNLYTWSTPTQLKVNGTESTGDVESPSLTTVNNITVLSYRDTTHGTRLVYSYDGYIWEGMTNISGYIVSNVGYPTVIGSPTGAYIIYYYVNTPALFTGVYGRTLAFSDIGGSNEYWIHSISDGACHWDRPSNTLTVTETDSTTIQYGVGTNGTLSSFNFTASNPDLSPLVIVSNYNQTTGLALAFSGLIEWVASYSDPDAPVMFTLSGLESGINSYYDIYVDGNLIDKILCTSGSITFSYSGPWSEHQFVVTKTKIVDNPNFSGLIILLIIIASISIGLLFFRYKEEFTIVGLLYLLIGIFVAGILLVLAVVTFWS